ncbi:MAG: SUMF1/EgtB/PvdO family nonheme iron enzyme [Verrucomicrobia bacterium]|nr:SUMF1/EgtB/PvdO family nonheme iron enzyme [Verrucomicrobiota bacterium]
MLTRRQFLASAAATAVGVAARPTTLHGADAAASPFKFEPARPLIPAPKDPKDWPRFRQQLAEWREQARPRLNYSDALYRQPQFAWAASSFACCFVMLCDETFCDARAGAYRVEEFLDDGVREFGGYDSLVLWHAYPRIGVDDRNQFDFYRDLPGGLEGLRDVSRRCHRRGVKVFIDYNPWDTGTRRESQSDLDVLCSLVAAIEADGIFLDTMSKGTAEFRAKLDAARPGVILEGEGALPLENVHDHHASWAQWFPDSEAPGVLRNKWFERRHLQHQIKRWDADHTGELHIAWMNGSGMMVWENVFGSWVGWSALDRSILRAMLPIQRRYAALLTGEQWTPLVPTENMHVFASLWEQEGLRLWTLVNRADQPVEGLLLNAPVREGESCFDLVAGRELKPRQESGQMLLAGRLLPRGIGCFASGTPAGLGAKFTEFLATQAATSARADTDSASPRLTTRLLAPAPAPAQARVPDGMVEVPAATLELQIEMRNRECGFYESSPPGGHRPGDVYGFNTRTFRRRVAFNRFAIDATPVTNAQFAEFLKAARYQPKHPENFLKHWARAQPPVGKEDHPVVYVDLDDARAYARWAGKRLPTEEEWQYAAQGAEGRRFPWGNEMQPGRCNGGETGGTTSVKSFPDGRSPCGCWDLIGNVWQWTESERTDGRTRFCILRGGAFYTARGSGWYVDGGPRPANFATKFLLTWPGLDRCATIGFRCAADLKA